MKTIHLICNAHIDPVWLWPWHDGVAETLATARAACDILDECKDVIFTRGESWVYQQIQRHDPETFERIRKHINNGRWEIVGGWLIQPDCNQPGYHGFEKQIELGKRYFQETFNQFPDIAYNVDSFGHNASLPEIMHKAGQRHYIMMRPQESEMTLPARLFRWRGYEGGPEIVTFRIAAAYTTLWGLTEDHVRASLKDLPQGVDHTMCFVGVGDHGGGPSRHMVQWCRDHADAFEGAKLVFSSPSRFFAAIASQIPSLPLVTGELQQHAVGCYAISRKLKTELRHAENKLGVIERELPKTQYAPLLDRSWSTLCFHHFHDTLGGTCLPSAYNQIQAEVGGVHAVAEDILRRHVIDIAQKLPPDRRQRIVIWNSGKEKFSGYVEHEPWLDWTSWSPERRLEDTAGNGIPYQLVHSEAVVNGMTRLVFPCAIEPGGVFVAVFDPWQGKEVRPAKAEKVVEVQDRRISNDCGTVVDMANDAAWRIGGVEFPRPILALIPDKTDTWSHAIAHYGKDFSPGKTEESVIEDKGPLMASAIEYGTLGTSRYEAEWRVYAGEAAIHLNLYIEWSQRHELLKLICNLPGACQYREDGVPGHVLRREPDGRELPLRDLTRVHLKDGKVVGVACPDTFALDGDEKQIRLTLLRSPLMAHHDPAPAVTPRRRYTDRGEHCFRFVFTAGQRASVENLEKLAEQMWVPPLATDLTRGMPSRLVTG